MATSSRFKQPLHTEKIYTSETGNNITALQQANELLAQYRADFIGYTGNKPWEHKGIAGWYNGNWVSLRNLMKKYGERVVLQVISDPRNSWLGNPKYEHGIMGQVIKKQLESFPKIESKTEVPKQHIDNTTQQKRLF